MYKVIPEDVLAEFEYSEKSPTFLVWRDGAYYPHNKNPDFLVCKRKSGDARLVQAVFKPEKFSEELDPVYAAMVAAENWRHTKLNEVNIVLEELGRTSYTERHKQIKQVKETK